MKTPNVVVWNENLHEHSNPKVAAIYPAGIHQTIADGLKKLCPDLGVGTATLQEPEHGLSQERLDQTDVLLWWGHMGHDKVEDKIVDRVQARVLQGMGLVVLHSGHFSKIFKRLMGTSCALKWREADEKERIWVCNPGHPIAAGLGEYFELPKEEMYGEPFGIPAPDEQVFISWFEGGEVFRSGCCWQHGNGKVFYFQPGHETYPIYHDANIQRVIANAVAWAAPQGNWATVMSAPCAKNPAEPIAKK
jgi:trehalose utilization protein